MTTFSAILIALGLFLLLLAAARTQRLIRILKDEGPWTSLRNLIGFFAVGYTVYLFLLLTDTPFDKDLITAEVFLLGALFILLAVRFTYRTVHEIMRLDELEQLANTDELTGLYNRRAILRLLEEEFWKARRYGFPLSVAMVDLDDFKPINDTCGHLSGDVVLRESALSLRNGLRKIDLIGRYGGDEFLCILPSTPLQGAEITAERMRARITRLRFLPDAGGELQAAADTAGGLEASPEGAAPVQLSASAGVASIDPGIRRPEELVARADAALYEAKQQGRNRTCTA